MTVANDFFNRLEGVWANRRNEEWSDSFGWNLISQPQLNNPSSNDFNIRIDQMRETITFKKIGQARNIGVTGQAGFWQSMSYEVEINTPSGEGIHHEMGHFLIRVNENGETDEALRADIIRQATIPRANAIMTIGELRIESIGDAISNRPLDDFYSGRTVVRDNELQAKIDAELQVAQQQVTNLQGPNLLKPLEWLQGILDSTVVGQDWVFSFRNDTHPSQMANGQRVINPVSIGNLLSDFWIADRNIDGEDIKILQYAQKVDLGFHGENWPHIAVNTLIKQS